MCMQLELQQRVLVSSVQFEQQLKMIGQVIIFIARFMLLVLCNSTITFVSAHTIGN